LETHGYNIAIIGAGPSGGILGAYLTNAGNNVTLVDVWKDHIHAIEKDGFIIEGVDNFEAKFNANNLKLSISDLKVIDPEIVFIAVKTPILKRVVNDLKNVISKKTLIVSYQNGIGTEDYLAENFSEERCFRVIINYAGNVISPGKVEMTFFNPPNYLGSVSPNQHQKGKEIAKLISDSGLSTKFQKNILPAEWKKGILNSSLSGLCAVTHMTMREAMQFPNTRNIVSNLIQEGIDVANAIGIEFNANFHEECMRYLMKGGHHKPSMLIDIENRTLTEVEFLNLKIVEIAEKQNVLVPYNNSIKSIIEALDFLNDKDRQYITEKVELLGFEQRCLTCSYVKDCIDAFTYCPLHGHVFPFKVSGK
jgi:2-dehydropantoate 2-reductase